MANSRESELIKLCSNVKDKTIFKKIKEILEEKPPINVNYQEPQSKYTPLLLLVHGLYSLEDEKAKTECRQLIQKLIVEYKADLRLKNYAGTTVLQENLYHEEPDQLVLATIIEAKPDDEDLYQAFSIALSTECVPQLVKAGANINVRNYAGNTPLFRAAEMGGERGRSACILLAQQGAKIYACNNEGNNFVSELIMEMYFWPSKLKNEFTKSLEEASYNKINAEFLEICRAGDLSNIEKFINEHKSEINFNCKDWYGNTPLMIILKHNPQPENIKSTARLTQTLLEAKTEIDGVLWQCVLHDYPKGPEKTPLQVVLDFKPSDQVVSEVFKKLIQCGNIYPIESLIKENKSYLEVRDKEGNTPLLVARQLGKEFIAEWLIKEGANKDAKNTLESKESQLTHFGLWNESIGLKKDNQAPQTQELSQKAKPTRWRD